jgi:hypothetical protein
VAQPDESRGRFLPYIDASTHRNTRARVVNLVVVNLVVVNLVVVNLVVVNIVVVNLVVVNLVVVNLVVVNLVVVNLVVVNPCNCFIEGLVCMHKIFREFLALFSNHFGDRRRESSFSYFTRYPIQILTTLK